MGRNCCEKAAAWAPLALRVGLGVIFLFHGAQKVLGLFDGPGLEQTIEMFSGMGHPKAVALAVAFGELLGGAAVLFGFLTRPAALGLAAIMVGAIVTVHGQNGFEAPAGFEYNFALTAMSVALVLTGGGRMSLDAMIFRKRDPTPTKPPA